LAVVKASCQNLMELQIEDETHNLSTKDVRAATFLLKDLAVASLSLACNKLEVPPIVLRVCVTKLTSLQSFSLTTEKPVHVDQLAEMPGRLTTLQGLTLITPHDGLAEAFAGTKKLNAAVLRLRNLRSLSTSFLSTDL
jgi:hypothetical protein